MDPFFPFTLPTAQISAGRGASALVGDSLALHDRRECAEAQVPLTNAPEPSTHQLRIDLLAQRLAVHLSQEVWQRLFHGAGRHSIGFTQATIAVLFVESLALDRQQPGQDHFLAVLGRIAREHGGTVDAYSWGGSLVFYPHVESGLRTAAALQRAAPEWKLRMGIDCGECLVARFRSAGGSHSTLVGAGPAEAAAVATASDYGSVGLSAQAHAEWLSMQFTLAPAGGDQGPQWRCERNGNGSMRLVPTNGPRPAA